MFQQVLCLRVVAPNQEQPLFSTPLAYCRTTKLFT